MNDHDYQKLYEEVNRELVEPKWRSKLAKLVEHAGDPLAADFAALTERYDEMTAALATSTALAAEQAKEIERLKREIDECDTFHAHIKQARIDFVARIAQLESELAELRAATGVDKWASNVRLAVKFAAERDTAVAQRDEALRSPGTAICDAMDVAEYDTAEKIAAWIEGDAREINDQANTEENERLASEYLDMAEALFDLAAAIRAGAYKPEHGGSK